MIRKHNINQTIYFYKTKIVVFLSIHNNAPKILGHSHVAAPQKFFRRESAGRL